MKKIFLTFFILQMAWFASAQTTIINENFSNGLPNGWSNSKSNTTSHYWSFSNPGNRTFNGGFDSKFAIVDGDRIGSGQKQNTWITTKTFDGTPYQTITLEFDFSYRDYVYNNNNESCEVEVYNGTAWISVFKKVEGQGNGTVYHETIDISTAVLSGAAKVRFTYVGEYDYWWAIDNVKITGSNSGGGGSSPITKSPGGASDNSFVLWLDANELPLVNNNKVTSWSDLSSKSNDAFAAHSDAPTYKTGKMNGYPVVDFTRSNSDYMKVAHDASLNPDKISIFIVSKFTNYSNAWASFVTKSNNNYFTNGYGILRNYYYSSSFNFINNYNYYRVSTTLPSNSDNIMTFSYNKQQIKMLNNGGSQATYNYNSSFNHSNNDLYIGAAPSNNGVGATSYLDGEIAEIIIYPSELTEINKTLIHNYLSSKYNIQLQSGDYYPYDNSGSGNYDHNVTGIGKAHDGSQVTSAKGTGIITISAENNLNSNTYLFWGENQKNSDYSFSTASDYMDRLNSVWRVSTYNNPGKVTISVDSAELDLSKIQPCAELKLVVANASNFQSKTEYSLTLKDGKYEAANVMLNNGDHFSYEYQDVIGLDQNGFVGGSGQNNAPGPGDECYKLLVASNANYNYNININSEVREIEVQTNGRFRIESNKHLIVKGDIVNNGTIILKENASLVQQSEGTNNNSGNGSYQITRRGNNNPYIFNIWSSPITQAPISTIFPNTNPCDIYVFENNTQSWKYDYPSGYSTTCNGNSVTFQPSHIITNGNGVMDVGLGYFVPGDNVSTRSFTGSVNNGDYLVPIVATDLGNPGGSDWADDDWNLIGNPYPSGLSADSFWKENAVTNQRITDALYFWDEASPSGVYDPDSDYASWNNTGGVESGNSSKVPSGNISSGQGFWVVAKNTSSVKFSNNMRVTENDQFFKKEQNDQHNAWFRFSSPTGYKNNILLGYNNHTTDSVDHGYDAHKLVGNAHIRFASIINEEEFVIQSFAKLNVAETKIIPLVVFTDESGVHTFSNYKKQLIPNHVKIYLVDLQENTKHDLDSADYQVALVANTTYEGRFQLEFQNSISEISDGSGSKDSGTPVDSNVTSGPNTIEDISSNSNFRFIQNESNIVINHTEGFSGSITVFRISGQRLWAKNNIISSSSETIPTQGFSGGTYIIVITESNNKVFTKKVIIH